MNALKWFWHLLFDTRSFDWRTSRIVNVWGSWHPYIGFAFDFFIHFVPPHTAEVPGEQDMARGPEFKFSFAFLWIDFGLTIPNDDHPDNDIKIPPRSCKQCGLEAEPMMADRCTGCRELAIICTCAKAEYKECPGCSVALAPTAAHAEGCYGDVS